MSLTPDEATSYYFATGFFDKPLHSNNHILNTQLMRLFMAVFGPSEWALRLPTVLSFLVYSSGVWMVVKRAKSTMSFFAGCVFLLLIPFVIDFFSLARGYGLSLAFAMLAFGLFVKGRSAHGHKKLGLHQWMVISVALSLLANFNAFNFAVMLFGWTAIDALRVYSSDNKKRVIILLGTMTLVLGLSTYALLELRSLNDLNFGAESYSRMLLRSSVLFLYLNTNPTYVLQLFWIGVFLTLILSTGYVLGKRDWFSEITLTTSIIVGMIVGWILEHELFGVNLPQGRMMIHLLPLFGALLFFGADQFLGLKSNRFNWKSVLVGLVIFAFLFNFGKSINLWTTRGWYEFAKIKDGILAIGEEVDDWNRPARIERYISLRNATNYYIETHDLNILRNDEVGIVGEADFLMVHQRDWQSDSAAMGSNYQVFWGDKSFPMMIYKRIDTYESAD